jgi:hypothetical protein
MKGECNGLVSSRRKMILDEKWELIINSKNGGICESNSALRLSLTPIRIIITKNTTEMN